MDASCAIDGCKGGVRMDASCAIDDCADAMGLVLTMPRAEERAFEGEDGGAAAMRLGAWKGTLAEASMAPSGSLGWAAMGLVLMSAPRRGGVEGGGQHGIVAAEAKGMLERSSA